MNFYLKVLFVLVLFLHTALAKLAVGLPVRTLALIFFLALTFLVHSKACIRFFGTHRQVILMFIIMTLLGGILAFLQGRGFVLIAEYFSKQTLQPLLVLICTYLAIRMFGLKFVAYAYLAMAIASGLIAILQFVGFGPAWLVRRVFGAIQGDSGQLLRFVLQRSRPMGLLPTPIMFSYHLLAGYIIAGLLFRYHMMSPRFYAAFVGFCLVASVANGTRSLLLGIVIHQALQLALSRRVKSIVALSLLGLIAVGAYGHLQDIDSRVVSTEDASAVGRVVLYKFGLTLAADNPFGLGWGVDPIDYAWFYWQDFSHIPRASAIFRLAIHNTFINFVLTYGAFGVLVVAWFALLNLRVSIAFASIYVAYFVNGFFHNAGIFVGDLYFWFSFAFFLHLVCDEQAGAVQQRLKGQRHTGASVGLKPMFGR